MANITRARKREIREKVRGHVADSVEALELFSPAIFDDLTPEEAEYAKGERTAIVERLRYTAGDAA